MNERGGFYCDTLWKDPKRMRRRKIPMGFCGLCLACGQPGHTRHSPLPVPCTETYCDACFDSLANEYDTWRAETLEGYTVDFVERRWQKQPQLGTAYRTPATWLLSWLSQTIMKQPHK